MKNVELFNRVNDECKLRGLPKVNEAQFLVIITAMSMEGKIEIDGDEVRKRQARMVRVYQEGVTND